MGHGIITAATQHDPRLASTKRNWLPHTAGHVQSLRWGGVHAPDHCVHLVHGFVDASSRLGHVQMPLAPNVMPVRRGVAARVVRLCLESARICSRPGPCVGPSSFGDACGRLDRIPPANVTQTGVTFVAYEARDSESAAARVFRSAVRSGSQGALQRVSSRFEDHPQGIRIRDEESGRTLKCAVAVVVSNSNPGMTLFPTLSTERQRPEKG